MFLDELSILLLQLTYSPSIKLLYKLDCAINPVSTILYVLLIVYILVYLLYLNL